jgi:hypothetical protein
MENYRIRHTEIRNAAHVRNYPPSKRHCRMEFSQFENTGRNRLYYTNRSLELDTADCAPVRYAAGSIKIEKMVYILVVKGIKLIGRI